MNGLLNGFRLARQLPVVGVICLLLAATGCNQQWHYWVLTDVRVALPELPARERSVGRAGTPAELLMIESGGSQTVLIASCIENDPAREDEERARTFIAVLEGPPVVGTCEVTPGNGRLILNSVFSPARRPYQGIEGSVEIREVAAEEIEVHCVFRNIKDRTGDDAHILRGKYDFRPPLGDDLALRQAGIRWAGGE